MVDSDVGAFVRDGLAAHNARANGVNVVGLEIADLREMDAVFVAEGQIREKVLNGVDAAFGEEFGALRADSFDHANFGGERKGHSVVYIILSTLDRKRRWS